MPKRPLLVALSLVSTLAGGLGLSLAACSESSSPSSSSSGSSGSDGGGGEADAAGDAGVPRDVCEGACRDVTVLVTQDGGAQGFERAQFGTEPRDGGALGFHVELHAGGSADCPTQTSPTPKRTFVIAAIPAMTPGATASDPDGVRGAFLDFATPSAPPVEKATKTTVTLVALDPAPQPQWLAMDVEATLPSGRVKGHLYATFCQSLSLP